MEDKSNCPNQGNFNQGQYRAFGKKNQRDGRSSQV